MRKYKNVSISNQDGFLWGFNVEFVHQINNINFDNCSYCFADMFSLEMAPGFMWFWCILVSFLQKLKMLIKMVVGSFLPVLPTLIMNAFVEVHMKLRVILINCFNPKKLYTLWLKDKSFIMYAHIWEIQIDYQYLQIPSYFRAFTEISSC